MLATVRIVVNVECRVSETKTPNESDTHMATPTNSAPDMIEIEIDNFVSPDVAKFVPSNEFIALEIDGPIAALAPTTETAPLVAETVATETPSDPMADLMADLAAIGMESAANSVDSGARHGSIRAVTTENAPTVVADLPVGQGMIVDSTVNGQIPVFTRATRQPMPLAGAPSKDPEIILSTVTAAIVADDEKLCGIELAWNPATREGHEIPRAMVCDLLDQNGRPLSTEQLRAKAARK